MKALFATTLFLVLVALCASHTLHFGRTCPNVQAFPNLSVNKILGLWYVVHQFDSSNTCLIWNLTRPNPNLDELELTETRQLYFLDAIGVDHKQAVSAKIDIPNPELPSKMRIRWFSSLTGKADFTIFDTDYETYLAIFQCDRAGIFHRRDAVILSKKPDIDDMFVERIRRLLDNADVRHGSLDEISHNKCRETSTRNWNIKSELFGLLPPDQDTKKDNLKELARGVQEYDLSEMEIIGDGISSAIDGFSGSIKKSELLR